MKTSPEAIAIACFTFVVAVLIGGWQQVAMLMAGMSGRFLPFEHPTLYGVVTAVAVGAPTAGAMLLAGHAAHVAEATWARAIGQATLLVGGIVLVAAALFVLSTALGTGFPFYGQRMDF